VSGQRAVRCATPAFVIAGLSALKTRVNALMTRQSIRFEGIAFFDGRAGQARA
jgi:hypothetical protein